MDFSYPVVVIACKALTLWRHERQAIYAGLSVTIAIGSIVLTELLKGR